jgi:hypothetical protein
MKFKVDLPILDLSTVVFEIEAESEDDAVQQARTLWPKHCEEILLGGKALNGHGRLELKPGVVAIGYRDFVDSWVGDDIYVDPVEEEIIESAG